MVIESKAISELVSAITSDNEGKKSNTYSATISRVDSEGVIWVRVAGSEKETPTASTSAEVKANDKVNVEWRNNKLYIAGNVSDPSAGSIRVAAAEQAAQIANQAAQNAVTDAGIAREAAESAQASAIEANTNAGIAKDAAKTAQESADNALVSLATAQDVVGVLTWITNHGTMTSQSGGTFADGQVYFIVDTNGDYDVGGTHYSVVAEPKAEDIDNYYVLSVSESVQNYVATHVAVNSEGLWIIPETNGTPSTNGKKVLIAVGGQGHRYETAGTYIIDKDGGTETVIAKFAASGATIGITDGSQSYLAMDYHSMQMVSKGGGTYFYVSDLRDANGEATVVDTLEGDGTKTTFTTNFFIKDLTSVISITINGTVTTAYTVHRNSINAIVITFTTAPADGDVIEVTYISIDIHLKAYTFGIRDSSGEIGGMSVAEGLETISSGKCSHAEGEQCESSGSSSHAEGYQTEASAQFAHAEGLGTKATAPDAHAEGVYTEANGIHSHAEGRRTVASGASAHAQNYKTVAGYDYQTAIGKFNNNDRNNAFEIGNGSSDNNRSNALEVTWDGNVKIDLPNYQTANTTDKAIYDALVSLGWDSEVLV